MAGPNGRGKRKRTLKKKPMKIEGRLSKVPRPLPRSPPLPGSAAAKASPAFVEKAALFRHERLERALEFAMRGGSQSTDIAQAVVEAPTDQASAAQEPTKQEKETAEEDEGLTSWRGQKRRVRVRWSEPEEAFLREAVQTYGQGRWKKILIAGRQVFLACRTNVDLKDKWRVMQKRSSPKAESRPKKKRRITSTPPTTPRATLHRVSPRSNKYTGSYAEEDKAVSTDEEEAAKEPKSVELQIASDNTYPLIQTIVVDVKKFDTVAKLRRQLSKKFKSSFSALITISTRRRPTDQESIQSILQTDGDAFYAVLEETKCDV